MGEFFYIFWSRENLSNNDLKPRSNTKIDQFYYIKNLKNFCMAKNYHKKNDKVEKNICKLFVNKELRIFNPLIYRDFPSSTSLHQFV